MVSMIRYNIHQYLVSVYYIIEYDVLPILGKFISNVKNDPCSGITTRDTVKMHRLLLDDNKTMLYQYMHTLLDFDIITDDSGYRLDDIKKSIAKITHDTKNDNNDIIKNHDHVEEISPLQIVNKPSDTLAFSIVTDDGVNKLISIPHNIIYDLIRNIRISERKPKEDDDE